MIVGTKLDRFVECRQWEEEASLLLGNKGKTTKQNKTKTKKNQITWEKTEDGRRRRHSVTLERRSFQKFPNFRQEKEGIFFLLHAYFVVWGSFG